MEIPTGEPEFVLANMKRFRSGKKFIPPAPTCPAGKVVNPETSRCVSADGPTGRKLLATAAIAPAAPPGAIVRPCPADKILNPATRRCVKRDGKVGKGLAAAAAHGGTRKQRRPKI